MLLASKCFPIMRKENKKLNKNLKEKENIKNEIFTTN